MPPSRGSIYSPNSSTWQHAIHGRDVRGLGLLCALELVKDRGPRSLSPRRARKPALARDPRRTGMLTRADTNLYLAPPLCIQRQEVDRLVAMVDTGLGRLSKSGAICDRNDRLMPHVPNIIILLLDTARAQSFSGYGYARPTSPHIDALAAESVVYERPLRLVVGVCRRRCPSYRHVPSKHAPMSSTCRIRIAILCSQKSCARPPSHPRISSNSWMSTNSE